MASEELNVASGYDAIVETDYPFLLEGEIARLDQLVNNFLSLGEWEPARAVMRDILPRSPLLVLRKLRRLATAGPPPHWFASAAVPTSYHLAWLAANEFRVLAGAQVPHRTATEFLADPSQEAKEHQGDGAPIAQALLDALEFHMLVHHAFGDEGPLPGEPKAAALKEELHELYGRVHDLHGASPEFAVLGYSTHPRGPDLLSADCAAALKRIFATSPLLAEHLSRHLSDSRSSSSALYASGGSSLKSVYQEIVDSHVAQRRFESACQLVPYLVTAGKTMDDPENASLRALLSRLAGALYRDTDKEVEDTRKSPSLESSSSSDSLPPRLPSPAVPRSPSGGLSPSGSQRSLGTTEVGNTSLRIRVYEALFQLDQPDSALRLLSHFEDANLQKQFLAKSQPYPAFFALYPSLSESLSPEVMARRQSDYWSKLCHFVRITRRHFLDYVTETSLRLIHDGKFADAALLIRPFPHLAPLLVLMSWHAILAQPQGGVPQLRTLLETFGSSPSQQASSVFVQGVAELCFQLQLATWSAARLLEVHAKTGAMYIGEELLEQPPVDPDAVAFLVLKQLLQGSDDAAVDPLLPQRRSLVFVLSRSLPHLNLGDLLAVLQPPSGLPPYIASACEHDIEFLNAYAAITDQLRVALAGDPRETALSTGLARLQQVTSHPAVQLHVIEVLFSLVFLNSANFPGKADAFPPGPVKFVASAAFVRLSLDLVRQGLEGLFEGSYGHSTRKLKDAWRKKCRSPDEVAQLEGRADRLHWLVREGLLRLQIVSVCHPDFLAAHDFMRLLLLAPQDLLDVCLRKRNWAQARQVVSFFQTKMPPAAVAFSRLQEEIAKMHDTISPSATELPSALEFVTPGLEPLDALCLHLDLAVTCGAPALFAPLAAKSAALLERLAGEPEGRSGRLDVYRDALQRYQVLMGGAPADTALRTAICSFIEPAPSSEARAALSYLSSQKLMLESLTQLRNVLNLLEKNAADPGIDVAKTLRGLAKSLAGVPQPSKGPSEQLYLPNFLDYILRVSQQLLPDAKNPLAVLKEAPGDIVMRLILDARDYQKAEAVAAALGVDVVQVIGSRLAGCYAGEEPAALLQLLDYVGQRAPLAAAIAALVYVPPTASHDTVLLFLNLALQNAAKLQGWDQVKAWVRLKADLYARLYSALPAATSSPALRRKGAPLPSAGAAVSPADMALIVSILSEEDELRPEEALAKVVEHLQARGDYDKAVQLADAFLPAGPSDALLILLLDNSPHMDPVTSSTYISRMRDGETMAEFVLKVYFTWPIEVCLRLLHVCDARIRTSEGAPDASPAPPSSRPAAIRKLLAQMNCYSDILAALPNRWRKGSDGTPQWLLIHEKCRGDLPSVIASLLDARHFPIAHRALTLFGDVLPPAVLLLQERLVNVAQLHALLDSDEQSAALQLLAEIAAAHKDEDLNVMRGLLERKPGYAARIFALHYLRRHHEPARLKDFFPVDDRATFAQREQSLHLLSLLPKEQAHRLSHLEGQPLLIIETLLMNEALAELDPLLHHANGLGVAELLITYAKRAIFASKSHPQLRTLLPSAAPVAPASMNQLSVDDVMKPARTPPGGNSASDAVPFLWLLTGNAATDSELRLKHYFLTAPNISLLKVLLDMAGNSTRAGHACLELCGALGQHLTLANLPLPDSAWPVTPPRGDKGTSVASGSLSHGVAAPAQQADAPAEGSLSVSNLINLLQQLLLYAKLLFMRDPESGSTAGAATCDQLMQHVELFQVLSLVLPGYSLCLADLADPAKARRLRAHLIEEDRHAAALEVAQKCNVEVSAVWAAWGLSLLRVGRYAEAREKISNALRSPPPTSSAASLLLSPVVNAPSVTSADAQSLLPKILDVLECRRDVMPNHLDNAFRVLRDEFNELSLKLSSSTSAKAKPSSSSIPPASPKRPPDARAGLPAPKAGVPSSPSASQPVGSPMRAPVLRAGAALKSARLDQVREVECLYYLERYGSGRDFVEFYLRHGQVEEALQFMLARQMPPSMFINLLFSHCLCHQRLPQLLSACRSVDRTLAATREYLLALCKYLSNRKTYSILLELQVFMGDLTRAALTCIKLFSKATDFVHKIKQLEASRAHFKEVLAGQTDRVSSFDPGASNPAGSGEAEDDALGGAEVLHLTEPDIAKYIKTINLQIDVTLFLQSQVQSKQPPPNRILSITLFGKAAHKSEIAEYLLVCYAFDLSIRVIQDFRLPVTTIYANAIAKIACKKLEAKAMEMLKAIKGTLPDEDWDEVVMQCVRVFAKEHDDFKTAERFVARLSREESKVDAYLVCGKLKSAYISAVKDNLIDKIKLVREEALRRNDQTVVQLCEKFLYLQAGPKPPGGGAP